MQLRWRAGLTWGGAQHLVFTCPGGGRRQPREGSKLWVLKRVRTCFRGKRPLSWSCGEMTFRYSSLSSTTCAREGGAAPEANEGAQLEGDGERGLWGKKSTCLEAATPGRKGNHAALGGSGAQCQQQSKGSPAAATQQVVWAATQATFLLCPQDLPTGTQRCPQASPSAGAHLVALHGRQHCRGPLLQGHTLVGRQLQEGTAGQLGISTRPPSQHTAQHSRPAQNPPQTTAAGGRARGRPARQHAFTAAPAWTQVQQPATAEPTHVLLCSPPAWAGGT